jgi:hypothetical protein
MSDNQTTPEPIEALSSYRRTVERICSQWSQFLERREGRLRPHPLIGEPTEEVTIAILEDLFTNVLDWPLGEVNHEVGHADIVLTDHGIRWLIVEAKRPRWLARHDGAIEAARLQATGYARSQKVNRIAISDGVMLYAADLTEGGLRDRVFASLGDIEPCVELFWLAMQGIWRERPSGPSPGPTPSQADAPDGAKPAADEPALTLHPKYRRPAFCFAYVGDPRDTASWKLPYLLPDGSVDRKRLPKAIGAILSNYRGEKVGGIPEGAIRDVLARLARAAAECGRLAQDSATSNDVYGQLRQALDQLGVSLDPSRPR